jgi:alkane 1-monooxygenase
MNNKLLINLRYLIAPVFILAAMYGVFVGGPWVWTGVYLLGMGIILDTLISFRTRGAGVDDNGDTNGWPAFQNGIMYAMLGIFVLLQINIAWRIYEYTTGVPFGMTEMFGIQIYQGITGAQLVGAVLSSGIFAGIGIIYGHELAHTKGFSFVIARWMMALSGSSHFCYAHVYNHHLELGCEDDPATAPRGRSLFMHFPKSYFGQSKFLYSMEAQRLAKLDKPFLTWENRWLRGYAMSLPSLFLFWLAGGWMGIACLAVIWMISNFELETLNYLEHYGLIREKGEPIDYRHSWDNSTMLTSWFFIEIGRQADHHDRGETHFWELDEVGAPNSGHGYFTLFALALFPPVFHSLMNKELKKWDEEYASEGEIDIANSINKQAGYA